MTGILRAIASRGALLSPFFVIAGLFAAGGALTLHQVETSCGHGQEIVRNMLASVDLVRRMGLDVEREHFLVDEHIVETEAVSMAQAEAAIAHAQADFADAARAYAPLATLPGEAERWQNLVTSAEAIRGPMEETLRLSRVNRDADAQAAAAALDPLFAAIDGDVSALVAINREAASDSLARLQALHRSSAASIRWIGGAGILLSLAIGLTTMRLLGRRQERLQRYSALLEQRNRDLDAFAGRVAHDLRGPLATATLAATRLSQQTPELGPMTATLRRSVARMDTLVDDLLTLSRIAADRPHAVCDPAVAAAQARDDLAAHPARGDVTLRVDVAPARLACDESLLRQVVYNLADNALKYRRHDVRPDVDIRGRPCARGYELVVSDNGVGMSRDDLPHLFEPFFRGARVRDRPGTGLGLSIVKRVVDASGGEVHVESEIGRGSTFRITLPLAEESAGQATSRRRRWRPEIPGGRSAPSPR